MKDPRIVNAYESLEPTDEAKKRMWENIVAHGQAENLAHREDFASHENRGKRGKRGTHRILKAVGLAACLVLVAGVGVGAWGGLVATKGAADNAMESQTAEGAFDGFFPQSPSAPQGTASGSEAPDTEYRYLSEEESDIFNTEEYSVVEEHGFTSVSSQPFSTFAADVDTASYANWRRMVNQYMLLDEIPDGAIRTEEFLNYFDYGYDGPEGSDLFGVNVTIGDCPWNPDTKLLVMGLQTSELAYNQVSSGNNLVFLIDVSGSMDSPDKLGLLKESFSYLVENLNPSDTVSIVTYSGAERVVLDGEPAENKRRILRAVERLEAGGSTNGQAGLAMAYEIAREHFVEGGNNRIVLASDGDLNVGMTSESELSDYVSEQRKSGIYLSVLGFGDGNYKDSKMETIANDGNGNYHYIDCLAEAEKVLGRDLCATMVTVADDVKLQLEFNPAYVKGYRQIGYENRELSADEFRDDSVDAGEVGTGHSVTVAYELVMTDSAMELFAFDSRYSQASAGVQNGEWFALNVRWKEPGADAAKEKSYVFGEAAYTQNPSDDWKFAAAVIEYCMIATDNRNMGNSTIDSVLDLLDEVLVHEEDCDCLPDEFRWEFRQLVMDSTE